MKMAYLVDLIAVREKIGKITDYSYIRYYYGPYNSDINSDIQILVEKDIIKFDRAYAAPDAEYIVYSFNTKKEEEFYFDAFSVEEIKIIDQVIMDLGAYGARALTEIAYKTEPMKKLGATLGGNEQLNTPLDLK
jgi:hypothetical protein